MTKGECLRACDSPWHSQALCQGGSLDHYSTTIGRQSGSPRHLLRRRQVVCYCQLL